MVDKRLELHDELLKFLPNVYFQPPSTKTMVYPCVVYNKTDKSRDFGNNKIYRSQQEYQLTVVDRNPDSNIADLIEEYFQSCVILQYYTIDNLNHVTLKLYY